MREEVEREELVPCCEAVLRILLLIDVLLRGCCLRLIEIGIAPLRVLALKACRELLEVPRVCAWACMG